MTCNCVLADIGLATQTNGEITICNQSSTPATFCIALQKAGASLSSQQYVNFNTPIPGNDTINLTLGLTMAATDVLSANANTASVSFNVFGSEIY